MGIINDNYVNKKYNFENYINLNVTILYLLISKYKRMNGFFKTILAGYGAKKLGGGCLGTIIVFVIIFYLLGFL